MICSDEYQQSFSAVTLVLYCCYDKRYTKDRLVYCALFLTGCTSKLQQAGILAVCASRGPELRILIGIVWDQSSAIHGPCC